MSVKRAFTSLRFDPCVVVVVRFYYSYFRLLVLMVFFLGWKDGSLTLLIKYTLRVLVQYIHNPSSSNEHVDGVMSWPCDGSTSF